jgi:hypothetical protein
LTPELDLVIQCARLRSDPGASARIASLAMSPLDWMQMLELATRHGIRPIVFNALRAINLPENVGSKLASFYQANASANLLLASELVRLCRSFQAGGVALVPLKGPLLAASLYGDLLLRESGDLDLLVHEHNLPDARRILSRLGYELRSAAAFQRAAHHETLDSPATGIHVELHWRLSARQHLLPPDTRTIWGRLQLTPFVGHQLPSLGVVDQFLFLVAHGTRHNWSSLKWLCDIAEFTRLSPLADWPVILNQARRCGALRVCLLALYLAADLLSAPVPPDLLCAANADREVPKLARMVRDRLQVGTLSIPARQRFLFQTKERFRDRVKYVYYQLITLTGTERKFIPLPKALHPLYHVLRPVLLLRHVAPFLRG